MAQVDGDIVKGIIEPARKKYAQRFGTEAPSVKFDADNFLPPPPGEQSDELESCSGGISVSSANGHIVCPNTFDARLQIAYQANLPEIRAALFGEHQRAT